MRQAGPVQIRSAFEAPGILRAFMSMLFARLPMGAEVLLLVLITNERTGSFAIGGLVAAAVSLSHAASAPVWGRLVDRRGPGHILPAAAAVHAASMVGFALLPASASSVLAVALGLVIGASMMPLSSVMRALWISKLDPDRRHAALSLEGVAMEIVYISGPLLFISLVGAWSLEAGALACAAVTLGGTLLFASAPAMRAWRPEPPSAGVGRAGALQDPGVRTLLLAMTLMAVHIPAMELGVSAFAEARDATGGIGLILAAWGGGSMIGGLIFGRRGVPEDPVRRLVMLFGGMSLGVAAPSLAVDMVTLAALIMIAGFFIAPSFAIAFGLLADIAPRGTVTEANTWINTGFGLGIAAGGAAGGWVVETAGSDAAYFIGAGSVAVAAASIALRGATLRYEGEGVAAATA